LRFFDNFRREKRSSPAEPGLNEIILVSLPVAMPMAPVTMMPVMPMTMTPMAVSPMRLLDSRRIVRRCCDPQIDGWNCERGARRYVRGAKRNESRQNEFT
jgi:hypothetical protein